MVSTTKTEAKDELKLKIKVSIKKSNVQISSKGKTASSSFIYLFIYLFLGYIGTHSISNLQSIYFTIFKHVMQLKIRCPGIVRRRDQ